MTEAYFADLANGIIYVAGGGNDGVFRLYGLDAKTGRILTQPLMPSLTQDPSTHSWHGFNFGAGFHMMADGTTVGVTWNGDLAREEIRKVDPKTMIHTLIAPIPGITTTEMGLSFADPRKGIVYVSGAGDDPNVLRLYGLDAKTGRILTQPLMPPFTRDPNGSYQGFNFGAGFQVFPRVH
jgi:hypothetical protein